MRMAFTILMTGASSALSSDCSRFSSSLVELTSMSESAERMMSLIWMAGALAAASTFLRISAISSSAAMTVATESPVEIGRAHV